MNAYQIRLAINRGSGLFLTGASDLGIFDSPRYILRHWLTRKLSYVILHVTNRCNLRCRTCFISQGENEPDIDFFRDLGRQLPSLMWLDIGGGEPFLRDDLPEICSHFRAQVLSIPTNGWNGAKIVDAIKEILKKRNNDLVISLSIDGHKEAHDAIRGYGSWAKAWATFEKLKQMNKVSVKINTVVTEANLPQLPEFMPWVRAMRPDAHSLILLRGDPRDPGLKAPSPGSLRKMLPLILSELRHYNYDQGAMGRKFLFGYHKFLLETSIATMEQQRQIVPCLGGLNHIVIWADKMVGCCEMLPPVASLDSSSLSEVMRSNDWKQRREEIARGACWCTHNCAFLSSIPFHLPSIGKLLMASLKR